MVQPKETLSKGLCYAQLNKIFWDILKELDLASDRIYYPAYPQDAAAQFRKLNYVETWRKCYAERFYDFELRDHSLIQFRFESFSPLELSFAYYECPYYARMSYEDFLLEMGAVDLDLENEYEDYLTQQIKEAFTPIRYDYCPSAYLAGRHPASHLHFGFKSNIRIATQRILRPLAFVFLVIRQVYPDIWQDFLTWERIEYFSKEVRDSLDSVSNNYWDNVDHYEMILH